MADSEFRQLVTRERRRFVQFVSSLLSEVAELDAEDVVQDVLLRLLERPQDITSLEYASAYVYRSLRNRVIDVQRAKKETVPVPEDNEDLAGILADQGTDVLTLLKSEERRDQLFSALAMLSEIEQAVVIGHQLEGRSFREMSELWQMPQNTLLSHKSRAMVKLKRILKIED